MFETILDVLFRNGRFGLLLGGYINTLIITLGAVCIGIALGVIFAVCKVLPRNRWWTKTLNAIADIYITIIRGTPILVQLFIFYYVVLQSVDMPPLLIAVLGFGINSGAYVAEIMRAGIMSVPCGQMEAGRSLGLSYGQTMLKVILPQAVKNILPSLGNEAIVLVKETSVASIITVKEFFNAVKQIGSATYNVTIPYLFSALVYLLTVMLMTFGVSKLEKYLRKGDAR